MPLDDDGRCLRTELRPAECGCSEHRNSEQIDAKAFKIRNTVLAVRDGVCVLNEDHLIVVDDEIGMVTEEAGAGGRTVVGIAHGWACARCTREIQRAGR